MSQTVICLLGPLEVTIDTTPVTDFAYAKVRALLAYLAVEADRPHPRAQLATLLWPDQPERTARASLSQALTTLRRTLGDRAAQQPLVLADAHGVQLDPAGALEVDVRRFLAALEATDRHPHRSWRTCAACAQQLRQAMALYRGDFLADLSIADSAVFEEWAALQRERLRQRALSALERLVAWTAWRGDMVEAIRYAQWQLRLEPLLEVNQRALMLLLAVNGDRAAALAQYKQLHALLAQELDVLPEVATTTLFQRISQGDLTDLQPAPPPCLVPVPPLPLVGRDEELREVCERLRDPEVALLTITGAGGIGKTRLAIEAARAVCRDFEDGVFFVELAGLSDADLVPEAVAHALGVSERPGQPVRATLRAHLCARHLLLVLDNFEHVGAAAALVWELLAVCPGLSTLVTSRKSLHIRAEHVFTLEPLAETHAVQLFVQRAQAAGSSLATDTTSSAIYSAICRRLDGLPLAIELIAVRARALSPGELLRQLDQPLQALVSGPRDLPPRHQALRNAIQWSYDLLDPAEQRAFRGLGVFADGWSVAAAQAVIEPAAAGLQLLEALHQASLVQRHTGADETRFVMLQTIREFALELLDASAEARDVRQRHAQFFASFAMLAYQHLLGVEAPRWQARVAAEHENLRAAFRWAMDRQAYEQALWIATGVWRFHWMYGRLREGLARLDLALEHRDQAPWELQASALRAAGTLAIGVTDYARARQCLEAVVQLGRRLNDLHMVQPGLTNLGYALLEQGDLETARLQLEESVALARHAGDPQALKFPLGLLAGLHTRLGDYAQARLLAEECLHLNQRWQDVEGTANALRGLGQIAREQDDLPRAQELAQAALELHRSLNHQLGMGQDHALFGDIACDRGQLSQALDEYHQCLRLWRERGNSVNSAAVLDAIARPLLLTGCPRRAAIVLAAAATIRERTGARLAAHEQAKCDETARACRLALGEAAFATARDHGRTLTLEQAIDLALEPASPAGT